MTTATIEPAVAGAGSPSAAAGRLRDGELSGSTLEDLVLGAWEDLAARGRARCPVCTGELLADGCGACGSELS